MRRPPPGSTLTDPRFPATPLFRAEQVDVAAVAGRLLFERGDAVGEAGALRCRGRGSQRGAACHDEDEAAEDRGRMHGHSRDASWFGCFLLLRSEEHTSELQSLMSSSYAVFCLKKKKKEV